MERAFKGGASIVIVLRAAVVMGNKFIKIAVLSH